MENKKIILYLEDDEPRFTADWIQRDLPDFDVVFGAGYHENEMADPVEKKFMDAGGLENLAIVCTDGKLIGSKNGWDVINYFRQEGWEGPAIYCGFSSIPEEFEYLFSSSVHKGSRNISEEIGRRLLGESFESKH